MRTSTIRILTFAAMLAAFPAFAQEAEQEDARPAETEPADEAAVTDEAPEAAEPESSLHVGGAFRFNYFLKSWDGQEANRDRFGDLALDTVRLNMDATYDLLRLSAEYRFYAGYSMLHHGYVGLDFGQTQLDVGVVQAPFGLLPYASHNWFFVIPYYLGLEDDYDFGVKLSHEVGALALQAAFFKNDEGNYTGSSVASSRYSYDVVPTTVEELGYAGLTEPRSNSETNQVNLRAAYTLAHGDLGSTELGLSGRYGQLYNGATGNTGSHWAAAAHLNGTYGPVNLKLEGIRYAFSPANPAGQDDSFVVMGAYDFPYKVASEGTLLVAGLAYELPVNVGPLDSLTFYDDFSALLKDQDGFEDSLSNVLGVMIAAGPIYTYVDLAMGKNHPWLGADYGAALAEGSPDADWETRFNVNVGWYF